MITYSGTDIKYCKMLREQEMLAERALKDPSASAYERDAALYRSSIIRILRKKGVVTRLDAREAILRAVQSNGHSFFTPLFLCTFNALSDLCRKARSVATATGSRG